MLASPTTKAAEAPESPLCPPQGSEGPSPAWVPQAKGRPPGAMAGSEQTWFLSEHERTERLTPVIANPRPVWLRFRLHDLLL